MFKNRLYLITLLLNYYSTSHAEWVEWLFDASATGQFDSNINRSFFTQQQRDDFIGKGFLSAGRVYQINDSTRVYTTAEFSGEMFERYHQLNQYTLGGKMVLTHKFGFGWQAPMLHIDFSGNEIFSASQLRSGEQFNTGFRLSHWLNDFLNVFAGYRFDYRNASSINQRIKGIGSVVMNTEGLNNSVFDLQGHSLETGVNLVIDESLQLNLGYDLRYGDVISNALPNFAVWHIAENAKSAVRDDALGGWTYRADGYTHQANIGLVKTFLDGHAASSLSYHYVNTQALDLSYATHQVQFSLHYSY